MLPNLLPLTSRAFSALRVAFTAISVAATRRLGLSLLRRFANGALAGRVFLGFMPGGNGAIGLNASTRASGIGSPTDKPW